VDIVGCLEIPSIDLRAPVTVKGAQQEGFATWLGGSPVKGRFSIIGGRDDVFRKLAKAKPGDRVMFTDIDGVRYVYEVTTQYHLKEWDKGDNDLMICFDSDSQTRFVLGCTKAL
jgi:LPXTG-site transpeptidase (sortase) family protein